MDNPFEMAHCLTREQLQERVNFIDEEIERLTELRKVCGFAIDIIWAQELGVELSEYHENHAQIPQVTADAEKDAF